MEMEWYTMVRNVKNEGMSFVEILVSMVILSIVVLVMTNVLVTSTRSHGKATDDDVGDMLALEKLAELQNNVIPAKSNTSGIIKDVRGQEYTISWEVDNSVAPPRAEVTVTWVDISGNNQDANIIGYIDKDNSCPTQSGSNEIPEVKTVWDIDNDDTDDEISERELPIGIPAHTPVIYLYGYDENLKKFNTSLSADEDVVKVSIVNPDASPANLFYLHNDTLKTRVPMTTVTDHVVEFIATDCEGATNTKSFTIKIVDAGAPVINSGTKITATIDENDNTFSHDYTVTGTAGGFTIDLPNAPTQFTATDVAVGQSVTTLSLTSGLDFEIDGERVNFEITAEDVNGKVGRQEVEVTVNDIPEAPTGITISNNLINSAYQDNDQVGVFTIDDPDATGTHTVEISGGTPPFKISQQNNEWVLLVNGNTLDHNNSPYNFNVKVINGTFSPIFPISITVEDGNDLCNSSAPWNYGTTPYSKGSFVKYNNKIFRAVINIGKAGGQQVIEPGTNTSVWEELESCTP